MFSNHCPDRTFATDSTLLSNTDVGIYSAFLDGAAAQHHPDLTSLLTSIPPPPMPSYGPLTTLSALLPSISKPWPVLELQQAYVKAWKILPEEAKAGRGPPEARLLLDRVVKQCKQSYSSLTDLLHGSSQDIAIISPENGRSQGHDALFNTVRNFSLPISVEPGQRKPVVAISLPNGPLLALTVLATATYYTAAPLAHGSGVGAEQLKSDVLQSRSNVVIAPASDVSRLGLRDTWLVESNIRVFLADLGADMNLVISDLNGDQVSSNALSFNPRPNHADDIGILLFTSGTSGTKKLVPLTIHTMVCGASMVIESWGLSPSMRCLNQMPLNHVGGLIRNLFAPVMSGGSLICCSAFDANLFWDCVEDYAPTWYYASPSMHQCILEAGVDRPEAIARSQIGLVCNAAGGLLPSLAYQIRDTFSSNQSVCTVLPSYGMTECMPISTPPLDYRLEKTGTSGISVGPEIAVLDSQDLPVQDGTIGRISVRGAPVFDGYLKVDDTIDKSCFTENGFFDTGDMGYLDDEGYLYITGRSKEVINRGGELISPFEVEQEVVAASADPTSALYGKVSKALAFSVMHDVLQEVVGIVVTIPAGSKRPSLHQIQEALKASLSQVKIPVLVVYMDGGLPTNNNKILRIKMAQRLGLPEVSDQTTHSQRHYEAICPPPNTPLSQCIACKVVRVNHDCLEDACRGIIPNELDIYVGSVDFYPELFLAPMPGTLSTSAIGDLSTELLRDRLAEKLDGYNLPMKINTLEIPIPHGPSGQVDQKVLDQIMAAKNSELSRAAVPLQSTDTAVKVRCIFSQILSLSMNDVSNASDFFELGGDSMKAGRLLSILRKDFKLRLAINDLFTHRQVSSLASLIDEKSDQTGSSSPETTARTSDTVPLLPGCDETHSSTSLGLLILQLVPLCIFYPMKRAFTWTIFMYCLAYTQHLITNKTIPGRLMNLVISLAIARFVTKMICPILAILFKWIVIGRYKEGIYPMWSRYHSRWWVCQKVIAIAGFGIFRYSNWSRVLYYRCLGTKIGNKVTINQGATLGEYDLITIGDGATLERCIVRPFAVERNTSMYLGKITIGSNASIGLASIVAPGTNVPSNTCIGPNSSSWELEDADESNRDLCSGKVVGAHWALNLFVGLPTQMLCTVIGAIPWLGCLVALVNHEPKSGIADDLRMIVVWFASPERVGYHYLAMAANASLGPAFFFASVLITKKMFDTSREREPFGRAMPTSQMTIFRRQLLRTLMPAPRLHKLTELFGTHYEATSIFMRALGANVGKHIYWPGTGPSVQDFDLLNIGDDVVFGSRSHLVTSDGTGSNSITIREGAMVADRVVLLPGVELGKKAVMGSGALTKRDMSYPADSTWVGSKRGEAICLSTQTRSEEKQVIPALDLASYNSSRTTLAQLPDSECSSISDIKKMKIDDNGHLMVPTVVRDLEASKERIVPASPSEQNEFEFESGSSGSSPFGRAFYQKLAPYRVWSQLEIFFYSTVITIATVIYWNIGNISAVQVAARIFKDHTTLSTGPLAQASSFRPFGIYFLFLALIIGIMAVQSLLVIAFLIAAKWILMGRRTPGNYDWDKSSYCQRWQLFLKLETFRRHCYGGNGILGMLTGTHWIVLYFRALGAKIGKDCALFAGGLPSLMLTEPDLLTLGDRVSVDDASLVGHINTRGKFELNPLSVGDRSVLRSGSRLLSGARMEADACLLEHTLVMAGDVVDAGSSNQGWPAEDFKGSRMPTMKAKQIWSKAG